MGPSKSRFVVHHPPGPSQRRVRSDFLPSGAYFTAVVEDDKHRGLELFQKTAHGVIYRVDEPQMANNLAGLMFNSVSVVSVRIDVTGSISTDHPDNYKNMGSKVVIANMPVVRESVTQYADVPVGYFTAILSDEEPGNPQLFVKNMAGTIQYADPNKPYPSGTSRFRDVRMVNVTVYCDNQSSEPLRSC